MAATIFALAMAVSVSVAGQDRARPSFDCAAAKSEVERAICADPQLAAADALMARLYASAQTSALGGSKRSSMPQAQRAWLERRRTACTGLPAGEQRRDCRLDFLSARNVQLASAALMFDPALALGALRRLEPEGARLLEAVRVYVAADGFDTASRERVGALLAPTLEQIIEGREASSGRELLGDAGIARISDIIASERNFIRFLQIASAFVPVRTPPLVMPCAAIVRRPDLLGATRPAFGSTLDNFIFASDCASTLPALPALDRLTARIGDSWPRCLGTVRFAALRRFEVAVDAARLGLGRADQNFRARFPLPRRERVPPALASLAITELSAHYERHGRVSAAQAPRVARARVRDLMEAAHACA